MRHLLLFVSILLAACGTTSALRETLPKDPDVLSFEECLDYVGSQEKVVKGKVFATGSRQSPKGAPKCDASFFSIAVGDDGQIRPVYAERVRQDESESPPDAARDSIAKVLTSLTAYRKLHPDKPLQIAIFAHGGMVTHESAKRDAEYFAPRMLQDGLFPIFLIWNSDFPRAYKDHLIGVTGGVKDTLDGRDSGLQIGQYLTVAARVVGDVGGGLFRAPQRQYPQLDRVVQSVFQVDDSRYFLYEDRRSCRKETGDLEPKVGIVPNVYFPNFSTDCHADNRPRQLSFRGTKNTALYPVRAISLVAGDIGVAAWNNMIRRTRLAFVSPLDFPDYTKSAINREAPTRQPIPLGDIVEICSRESGLLTWSPDGRLDAFKLSYQAGFSAFFSALEVCLKVDDLEQSKAPVMKRLPTKIDFYGHSMGAIVANELARYYPDLPYRKIVFMGAAASIRETEFGVWSLMQRSGGESIEFYNLSLHPIAESQEFGAPHPAFEGVIAQGSLLEWIDEIFAFANTRDDRTLGKWVNILEATPSFSRLRASVSDRMTFRVFPFQRYSPEEDGAGWIDCVDGIRKCHPVAHGQFNDYSFWRDVYLVGTNEIGGSKPVESIENQNSRLNLEEILVR